MGAPFCYYYQYFFELTTASTAFVLHSSSLSFTALTIDFISLTIIYAGIIVTITVVASLTLTTTFLLPLVVLLLLRLLPLLLLFLLYPPYYQYYNDYNSHSHYWVCTSIIVF